MPDGNEPARFDASAALAPLKAFQRATVDHAFRRLMTDPDRVRQFLVADEVGLGKTMVARGVIARTIEALWDSVPRIDIVYVCSNGAIAAQNLARLNVMDREAQVLPTRLTLLPLVLGGRDSLRGNKVNFVSLTPGTTFDLKSSGGMAAERALILRLIADLLPEAEGPVHLFQGWAGEPGWAAERARIATAPVDPDIAASFRSAVTAQPGLLDEIADLAAGFLATAEPDLEMRRRREALVGRLRNLLARVSVSALEPDLIILDEFQRFHDLLHGDSEAADLARQLFDFTDAQGNTTRTLLLSATPYRMLTLRGDEAEAGDHHREFLEVLEFLFGKEQGKVRRDEIAAEMHRYRTAMQRLPGGFDEARGLKRGIETGLRSVIARTERVAETDARDAMIREVVHEVELSSHDLMEARAIAEVARAAGAPGTVEYWKSAPWLLSFMRGYKLADAIRDRSTAPDRPLREAMRGAARFQLDRDQLDSYAPLAVPNGRMRRLMDLARQDGLNRRLWMPPALPYFGPAIPASKILVFSEWTMVPDAVAALLSYEAEREMGMGDSGHGYFDHTRPRPLQFRVAQGRLAGLRALQLVIPSPGLAALIDPLAIHRAARPGDAAAMRQAAIVLLQANRLPEVGRDQTDWAAAAAMDRGSDSFMAWLAGPDLRRIGDEEAWAPHVAALAQAMSAPPAEADDDAAMIAHLADVALGSPATCALRALARLCPGLPLDDPALLSAAARIGMGFRTLFNQPEAQALLRAESEDFYWRAVLHHAAEHDLQSVLDEYAHVLLEAEGLVGHLPAAMLARLAEAIVEALTLRPAQIDLNRYIVGRRRIENPGLKMRGRFAMRLTGKGESEDGIQRTGIVRTAFNSPFRPFVLATTSVGQEGLDFHPYCHRLVHWNLPRNPVDMEQREGRVHRYKNHAVRLNLAARFAEAVEAGSSLDPWAQMFGQAHAQATRPGDLEPFWLLEGPHRIERHVLSLPFSREETRLGWLKRSVAIYRLAFGQPRQDDLLAFLDRLADTMPAPELAELQIDLRPASVVQPARVAP